MYNINDKNTQSVAQAVKQVIEAKEDFKPHTMYDPKTGKEYEAKTLEDHLKMKDMGYTHEKPSEKNETEVQDSDKDAVDLHAVDKKKDPEKERQVEEKEVEDEDEVEEGNEFTAAAAKAKLAGKDKFEFEGKTYPVEIEKDAAEKILGKKEEVEITEDVDNFFGFKSKDKLVQFQSMAKKLKIKPSGNATIMKRMGTDYHVMPFSGKVKDIEKAISVAVEVEKGTAESIEEMFNRLKPDDVRDSYGTIELKYRSSADIRDAEDKLKKAGINVRKSGDTLEVNSDSPAFKKAKITSSFDSSKREKAIMKVLGESVEEGVELKEETFDMFFDGYNSDWTYLKQDAKKMKAKLTNVETQFGDEYRFTLDTTKSNLKKLLKKYGDLELDESVEIEEGFYYDSMSPKEKKRLNSIYKEMDQVDAKIEAAIKKGDAKTVDKLSKEKQKLTMQVVNFYKEDVELEEASTDLEEAMKPADFVKGGDTKITKREVDGMLSKLFIDSKLAKAVEANSAFKNGEKSNGKKNPHKKDTADFHLFELGQQSASAE